jgi:hypothetical protein
MQKRAGGVAQGEGPEFKPQYYQKKKNKENNQQKQKKSHQPIVGAEI